MADDATPPAPSSLVGGLRTQAGLGGLDGSDSEMSGIFWTAAGAGAIYKRLKTKAQVAELGAEMQSAANRILARPLPPRYSSLVSFEAPGKFSFGLPKGFQAADLAELSREIGTRPLLAVERGLGDSRFWLAVLPRHMTVELTNGQSPWVVVVNRSGYQQEISKWGGEVVAGPIPILVDGERAVWSIIDANRYGQPIQRWTILTVNDGRPYEVVLGSDDFRVLGRGEAADALWAAMASWQWSHSRSAPDGHVRAPLEADPYEPSRDIYEADHGRVTADPAISLPDLQAGGDYAFVNPQVTEANFSNHAGATSFNASILHFAGIVTPRQVLDEMGRRAMRPATITELAAFGATRPPTSGSVPFAVIALGSLWKPSSRHAAAPQWREDQGRRSLNVKWVGPGWYNEVFLGARAAAG